MNTTHYKVNTDRDRGRGMIFYPTFIFIVLFFSTFLFLPDLDRVSAQDLNIFEQVQSHNITLVQNPTAQFGQIIWSGTMFTRKIDNQDVTFILTCGHGIQSFSNIKCYRKIFKDGLHEKTYEYECKPIYHSYKYDIAVYMLNSSISSDVKVLKENLVQIGEPILNVGAFSSYQTSDCVTQGIVSRTDVYYELAPKNKFDVSNCDVSGGFSGGGVYRKSDGAYIGFNALKIANTALAYKPIRDIKSQLKSEKLDWVINKKLKSPSMKELKALNIIIKSSERIYK